MPRKSSMAEDATSATEPTPSPMRFMRRVPDTRVSSRSDELRVVPEGSVRRSAGRGVPLRMDQRPLRETHLQ
jgi:hypothetical protein